MRSFGTCPAAEPRSILLRFTKANVTLENVSVHFVVVWAFRCETRTFAQPRRSDHFL